MLNSALFSKNTDNWSTPSDLYCLFKNCIDPFPLGSCEDNLSTIYSGFTDIYINPPFSKLKFIPKFIHSNLTFGRTIYLLIPSRTDTCYFHELLKLNPHIFFIRGRFKFNDVGCAPFPSILMVFNEFHLFSSYESITYDGLKSYLKIHLK